MRKTMFALHKRTVANTDDGARVTSRERTENLIVAVDDKGHIFVERKRPLRVAIRSSREREQSESAKISNEEISLSSSFSFKSNNANAKIHKLARREPSVSRFTEIPTRPYFGYRAAARDAKKTLSPTSGYDLWFEAEDIGFPIWRLTAKATSESPGVHAREQAKEKEKEEERAGEGERSERKSARISHPRQWESAWSRATRNYV